MDAGLRATPSGPRAAAGSLLALLGAWAFFVPLVGPYFDFGFDTGSTWSFSEAHWTLSLLPGAAAVAAGLALAAPRTELARLAGLLAAVAGVWLLVGPTLYPLWSSGTLEPAGGSEARQALLWIGYFYGTGALVVLLAGLAGGLVGWGPARSAEGDREAAPPRRVEPRRRYPSYP